MTVKDIKRFSNNYSVGQKIHCEKPVNGEKKLPVDAEIVGKYPYFCVVTDTHRYKWSVPWIDLMVVNG